MVNDIVLDTGCARTMVCKDLVPEHKTAVGESIRSRCVHGDITYPVADLNLEISGVRLQVRAAVAEELPVAVLLGTAVPELGQLLHPDLRNNAEKAGEVLVVTRAQARVSAQAEADDQPNSVETGEKTQVPFGTQQDSQFSTFHNDLFRTPLLRAPLTKREKRRTRYMHGLVRAKDRPLSQQSNSMSLDIAEEDIKQMEDSDTMLNRVRELPNDPAQPFFTEDGLLYRNWEPWTRRGQGGSETVSQLILPKDCHPLALELTHSIPGSNFQSQLLKELYHLLHVDAIRTSPYHPHTDGVVERFNQTLKSMLRKTAAEEGKDWDKMIPFLLFAYREVPQESTGFKLLYGRDVRGPLDVLKERWVADKRSNQNVLSYVLHMREKLAAMSQLAKESCSQTKSVV